MNYFLAGGLGLQAGTFIFETEPGLRIVAPAPDPVFDDRDPFTREFGRGVCIVIFLPTVEFGIFKESFIYCFLC